MVDVQTIKAQLSAIDDNQPFWVSAEIKELPHVIVPNETIKHLVAGRYEGGIALIVATDHRVLIIDKKPMFLMVEDVRYEMISEIDFGQKLFDCVVHINSFTKSVWFNSYRKKQLRALSSYIQHRLSEMRNQQQNIEAYEQKFMEQMATAAIQDQAQPQPYTASGWEEVNERANSASAIASNPMFMRKRISKFTRPATNL